MIGLAKVNEGLYYPPSHGENNGPVRSSISNKDEPAAMTVSQTGCGAEKSLASLL